MSNKIHPSVNKIWNAFTRENKNQLSSTIPTSWYFCDNEKDANECADLVMKKIKQATCSSLISFEKENEPLPKVGDIDIITNWNGEALAIIETTEVTLITYHQIDESFAIAEGEGDKSLAYWKKVHWDFFKRELAEFGESPSEGMMLIAQKFKTIYS
ncbi:MAG: RNA-binding protein [Flavobacteriales bacterium]|nr:MAG: RNA-binding protein [Flavobacteriales bacterium]